MTPSLATAQVAAAHLTPGDTIRIRADRFLVVARTPLLDGSLLTLLRQHDDPLLRGYLAYYVDDGDLMTVVGKGTG